MVSLGEPSTLAVNCGFINEKQQSGLLTDHKMIGGYHFDVYMKKKSDIIPRCMMVVCFHCTRECNI